MDVRREEKRGCMAAVMRSKSRGRCSAMGRLAGFKSLLGHEPASLRNNQTKDHTTESSFLFYPTQFCSSRHVFLQTGIDVVVTGYLAEFESPHTYMKRFT